MPAALAIGLERGGIESLSSYADIRGLMAADVGYNCLGRSGTESLIEAGC
jgi:hypothetical protein